MALPHQLAQPLRVRVALFVGAEGDYISGTCSSAVDGDACGGRFRIEVVISDRQEPARVLHGARCETCEAYYLFDPGGGRLIPK